MDSLTRRLQDLSSAEDFLGFFGVPYEERVVHVNRLHILKRFTQYLHQAEDLGSAGEVELFRRYRELLSRAYGDFVASTAAREKMFKVFQEAGGSRSVPLGALEESLAARRAARGGPLPADARLAPLFHLY